MSRYLSRHFINKTHIHHHPERISFNNEKRSKYVGYFVKTFSLFLSLSFISLSTLRDLKEATARQKSTKGATADSRRKRSKKRRSTRGGIRRQSAYDQIPLNRTKLRSVTHRLFIYVRGNGPREFSHGYTHWISPARVSIRCPTTKSQPASQPVDRPAYSQYFLTRRVTGAF